MQLLYRQPKLNKLHHFTICIIPEKKEKKKSHTLVNGCCDALKYAIFTKFMDPIPLAAKQYSCDAFKEQEMAGKFSRLLHH